MKSRFTPSLRIIHCLVLTGLLVSAGCNRPVGPKGLSESTYSATQKAVDALERASVYRNSDDSLFQPKFDAASKAANEVYTEMGNKAIDGSVVYQVRSCVEQLKLYRSTFESREAASQPIEEQLKGLKGTQMKDANDVVARNGKDVDDCIGDVKAYL